MFDAHTAREARLRRSGGATSPTDWIFRARMASVSTLADWVLAWMAFIRSIGSSMSVARRRRPWWRPCWSGRCRRRDGWRPGPARRASPAPARRRGAAMWARSAPDTRPSTTSLTLTPSVVLHRPDVVEAHRRERALPVRPDDAVEARPGRRPSPSGSGCAAGGSSRPARRCAARTRANFRGVCIVGISARGEQLQVGRFVEPGVLVDRAAAPPAAPGSARGRTAARRGRHRTRRPSGSGGTW